MEFFIRYIDKDLLASRSMEITDEKLILNKNSKGEICCKNLPIPWAGHSDAGVVNEPRLSKKPFPY